MGRFHRRPTGELRERPDRAAGAGLGSAFPGATPPGWGKSAVGFKMVGVKGLFRSFANIKSAGKEGSAEGLYEAGEKIMGESQKSENVPVKTGLLRSTGHVIPPQMTATGRIAVILGYGSPVCKYAVVQHEGKFNHPGGGRRHFLLIPTLENLPSIRKKVGGNVKAHIVRVTKKGTSIKEL
jgi:hypothetical protein